MKLPKLAKETPVNNGISTTNLKRWVYWISGCHLSRMLVLWEGTSQTWGFHQPDAEKNDGKNPENLEKLRDSLPDSLPERRKSRVDFFEVKSSCWLNFHAFLSQWLRDLYTPIDVKEIHGFWWGVRGTERYSESNSLQKNGWTFTPFLKFHARM